MTLIILLLCLGLQYFTNTAAVLPRYNWMLPYSQSMHSFLKNTPLWNTIWGVVALAVPPIVVVAIVDLLLRGRVFGLLNFLFNLIVLFYCLYAENLQVKWASYFGALQQQDFTQAKQLAETHTGERLPNQPTELYRAITHFIFNKALTSVFAYIFWFSILGIYGVIIYYTISQLYQLAESNQHENFAAMVAPIELAKRILEWLPIRLVGLSYALVGHFGKGFSFWLKHVLSGLTANDDLTWQFGLAALNKEPDLQADATENQAAAAMIDHALGVWLVAIALFVMGYWMA